MILVLCSTAVLIFFIHHVPMRIHINSVIEQVGERLIAEIDNRFPMFVGKPLQEAPDDPRIPTAFRPDAPRKLYERLSAIRAQDTSYIQLIDEETLIRTVERHGLVVRLHYQSGDFAHRGSVLAQAGLPNRLTRMR